MSTSTKRPYFLNVQRDNYYNDNDDDADDDDEDKEVYDYYSF